MRIGITVDLRDFLAAAEQMKLQNRLPEFVAKTLAVSARDLAYNNAAKQGGRRFWRELADGVRVKAEGLEVTIDHVTNDTNHLAEHVHEGGVIRPKNARYLAIPIDKSVEGENARDHTWKTDTGKPVFVIDKNAGARGRAFMAEKTGKKGKLKMLFVLVRQTKPQRARPWWPKDEEFQALAERETKWWTEQYLPKTI